MTRDSADDDPKLMVRAAQTAHRMGHRAVDSEHLLLAAVEAERCRNEGAIPESFFARLSSAFESIAPPGDYSGLGRLPLTACVKEALEAAATRAATDGRSAVELFDVMTAIVSLSARSGARRMLEKAGISEIELLSFFSGDRGQDVSESRDEAKILGHTSKIVVDHAHEVAREYRFERAQPWHLLVALAEQPDVITKDVLDRLGITAAMIRSEITNIIDEISRGGG